MTQTQTHRTPKVYKILSPQQQTVAPKRGIWRTLDITDGLPSGVLCLLQDRRGYLWIGTFAGLYRYDGAQLISYTVDDGLAGNCIAALCEDHLGRLWIGTGFLYCYGRGVSCFNGETFTNYTTKDGLAGNHITTIAEDQRGRLWIGTQADEGYSSRYRGLYQLGDVSYESGGWGISCYDGGRFVNYTTADGLASNDIHAIYEDSQGRLWIAYSPWGGTDVAVTRFDGKEFITYTASDGLADNRVSSVCEDQWERLWFGTRGSGVSCFDGERFVTYTTADGLAHNEVRSIGQDRLGRLWFGTWGGVSCFDGERFVNYTTADGLLDNHVYHLITDREGGIWFAHEKSGLTRFDPQTVQTLTIEPVFADSLLIRDRVGQLWYSNRNRLYCLSEGQQRCQTFHTDVQSLLEDSRGNFWVGTRDGLYCYDSTNAVWRSEAKRFGENDLGSDIIWSLLEAGDGTIWAGTDGPGYLCRFDGQRFEAIVPPQFLIFRLFEDCQGRLWVGGGFCSGGLSCYDGKQLINYTTRDGLPDNSIRSIVEDDGGNLWFGGQQGLCCFDGRRFITYGKEQGLQCPVHHCATRDAKGHLWFGTLGGGVYRYNGKHFQQLTTEDGLPSNSIVGLVPESDGSMIIGTVRGIVHYHPTATTPPPIDIREVVADRVYRNLYELELTTTAANLLTVSYHGLSLSTPRLRYSYILDGHDQGWQDTWENQVRYENLPPGEYTFKVIAINRDLVPSESPATLNLKVVPDSRDLKVSELQSTLQLKDRQLALLQREMGGKYQFESLIGESEAIGWVRAMMERAIDSGLNVLITGETGTGKELVALGIHYNSPRKDKLPVPLNCAAVQRELIGAELFGHCKGAFTGAIEDKPGIFEVAHGSTLLLDEIGDLPADVQGSLLRVLEEGKVGRIGEHHQREVDVRVIAMTNRNLQQEIKEDRFREDLYYRLNRFNIYVPPLRDPSRKDDIPPLAERFLRRACETQGKAIDGFAPGVMDLFLSYRWPGNVRELEQEIHRAVAFAETGGPLQVYHLSSQVTQEQSAVQEVLSEGLGLSASLKRLQRRIIEAALRESDGNRTQAAKRLEIDVANLRRLIRQLGIKG